MLIGGVFGLFVGEFFMLFMLFGNDRWLDIFNLLIIIYLGFFKLFFLYFDLWY